MTILPKVKLKALVTYPATVNGGAGIGVTKANGVVTVDLKYSEFGTSTSLPVSATSTFLVYDTALDSYVRMPANLFGGGVAGISDAPSNGLTYGRNSAAWVQLTSAMVNTTAGFTSAITRTQLTKNNDWVSVLDFNVDATGSADSTAGMQAAHNTGKMVFYPAGTYKFSNIIIANGGIIGDGIGQTSLVHSLTDGSTAINYTGAGLNGTNAPRFESFKLSTNPKSGGAGIGFNISGATPLYHPSFKNLYVIGWPYGIYIDKVVAFTMESCQIVNSTTTGLYISNTINGDQGDHAISNCVFGGAVNIKQNSAGGVKVTNCKFIGGTIAYSLEWISSNNSADLLISNCSIEAHTSGGIVLSRTSGTATFRDIVITGNEINVVGAPIVSDASGAFSMIAITGNSITSQTAAVDAIQLTTVGSFIISGNVIAGNGGGNYAIRYAGTSINGLITGNKNIGCTNIVNAASGSITVNNNV